jgi:VIT family protein
MSSMQTFVRWPEAANQVKRAGLPENHHGGCSSHPLGRGGPPAGPGGGVPVDPGGRIARGPPVAQGASRGSGGIGNRHVGRVSRLLRGARRVSRRLKGCHQGSLSLTIAGAYIVGGFIPLGPYILLLKASTGLVASVAITLLALAVFGYAKGHFTGAPPLRSSGQTVLIGGLAAGVAFVIARVIS